MKLFSAGAVVAVTGASRGIGRATAVTLGAEGAHVVLGYKENETAAKEIAAAIASVGGSAQASRVDVADEQSTRAFFRSLRQEHDRLDAVVNSAGITRDGFVAGMSLGRFKEVVDTNLVGTFLVGREAMKIMANQRYGSIVNVSSALSLRGGKGQANYVATKAAILAFTRALALEGTTYNVRVNAISPGYVETDMTRGLPLDAVAEQVPIGRLASASEIAAVIAFLCSDQSSYMTGSNVVADGGVVVR